MFYDDIVYDHFENPKNVGIVCNPTHSAIMGSPHEGAVIKLTARIINNTIEDIAFKAYGGGALIASMSLLTEKVKGGSVEKALEMKSNNLSEELHLEPVKLIYSIMAVEVLKKLLNNNMKVL